MMLALLGLVCPPLASAQPDSAGPDAAAQSDPSAQSDSPVSQYSDQELRSFAAAAVAVQQVKDTYGPMLAAATTSQEEQRVIRMAGAEMVQAVQDQGLSVERFQQILDSAQADPALVERINRQLNAR
jgi:hypothetical protein